MRKRFVRILVAAALLSVTIAAIGSAQAFFTTYVEVRGQKTVHMGDTTTVDEKVVGDKKIVAITNSDQSVKAVWVRARAIIASKYESGLTFTPGAGWSDTNPDGQKDGYWYYVIPENTPLEPGNTTTDLIVEIKDWPEAEIDKDFNVVVVYETTPAVENGTETAGGEETIVYLPPTMDDWNRKVEVKQGGGNS